MRSAPLTTAICMSSNLELCDPKKHFKLKASRWIHFRAFFDTKALKKFFHDFGEIYFLIPGKVGSLGEVMIDREDFFSRYDRYLHALKNGTTIDKSMLNVSLSLAHDAACIKNFSPNRCLVEICKPVIRVSLYNFYIDTELKKVVMQDHPEKSVSFGLEFSFPYFYENPLTFQPEEHYKDLSYQNTKLFRNMQSWMRHHMEGLKVIEKSTSQLYFPQIKILSDSIEEINSYKGLEKLTAKFYLKRQ